MSGIGSSFLSAAVLSAAIFNGEGLFSPSSAQEKILIGQSANENTRPKAIYVDSSDVIVLDVSSSMDDSDIIAAFQGAAEYYTSERNLANYSMGICAQSTIIFFGEAAFVGASSIICNEAEARAFAKDIKSEDLAEIRLDVGITATHTGDGIHAAYIFFCDQERSGNIKSAQYRVVVVGDELQISEEKPVKWAVDELTISFSAQIFGLAIGSKEVRDRFTHFIATDKSNFPATLAFSPEQVGSSLNEFLRYTNG